MSEQSRPAELIPLGQSGNMPAVKYYPPNPAQLDVEPESPTVPLSHYLWILRRNLWKIVAFVAVCILITFVVTARLKPIYESTATIYVDRQTPAGVVGENSRNGSGGGDDDRFLATQIRLIQSDAVVRPVAEQFHLIGRPAQPKGNDSAKAQQVAETPVALSGLRVGRPTNTYLLLISFRSPDPRLAADIANATANSYLALTYNIRNRSSASMSEFMEKQIDELKAKMEKSNLALAQFEKDLDLVNPDEKTNILSSRLMQLNGDYTIAQSERVRKEADWDAMKSGSIEATQISSQSDVFAKLTDALNQAGQRFAKVKSIYGPNHPEYRKAALELEEVEKQTEELRRSLSKRIEVEYQESLNREQMLKKTVDETKSQWDQLNAKSFGYQQVKREADTDKALYDELVRKIREADINSGFQNNNIRIADVARPTFNPVYPNMRSNLMTAFFFSTLIALGAVLLLDALDTTLRDPKEASRFLGTDVIGTLPIDRAAAQLPRTAPLVPAAAVAAKLSQNGNGKGYYRSTSDFEEAVRTIRNTILLSDFEGRLRSIVLTSAAPSEGKTTMAAHLAISNADRGKKTLIVDADLRRPSLHTKFGVTPREGLSNVLTGELAWPDVVLSVEGKPNLSILPAGPGSHRAADLIGPRLSTLLDEFAKEFDLVILDSPPLLGFAECLQMATAADGVLIISRAGETRRKAVAEVISVLNRLRANIVGVVLNQVSQNTSSDGYSYYGYYRYGHYGKYE
jgi:capsular exopolysaccharide synthesis family protein